VFTGSTAEKAGVQVGDIILEVDGEKMTASAPEDYEQLPEWIRQYKIGSTVELAVLRGDSRLTLPVELVRAPELSREMKKYRDENFEFTVRDITFFDKAREKWGETQAGVLVQEVAPGGWAALGGLSEGDLLLAVDGKATTDVMALETEMQALTGRKPVSVVFKILRGIYTSFLELEPKWEEPEKPGKE
jgi:S1-C subfamily serine protease